MSRRTLAGLAPLLLLLAIAGALAPAAATQTLGFYVNRNNWQEWEAFLQGRDPLAIDQFSDPQPTRHVLEHFWFLRAAIAGGCDCRIHYRPLAAHQAHRRLISMLDKGDQLSLPVAVFESDPRFTRAGLAMSEPVMEAQWFKVGLYTAAHRDDVLSRRDERALRALRFGVAESWHVDRQVIERLGVSTGLAPGWPQLLHMIELGRLDVLLQPFAGSDDLGFEDPLHAQSRFVPVPGWYVPFPIARRYLVDTREAAGEALLAALNRGLRAFKADGSLLRSYTEAGVINARVEGWRALQ